METAILRRTSRILAGHLWVFSNELVGSPKRLAPGSLVELRDMKDAFLGIGYANPHSLIAVRILTRVKEEIDGAFFVKRIRAALDLRKRFVKDTDAFRAVFSESDGLPGLIVDKYGDTLSIQFSTLGMEAQAVLVIAALEEVFEPKTIVLRNDASIRTLEGLNMEKKVVKGSLETLPVIKERGTVFEVDPMAGQKTGFFLDQAENREAFKALVSNGKALDLFCYTGAWAIKLAEAGSDVTGVDSSETAVKQAERNALLNNLSKKCSFIRSDVFEFVKAEVAKGSRYDAIVLDPPAFVKSKANIKEGLKAYRESNASCMKLLKEGGLFATSSCSFHVDRLTFLDMLRSAARDAGKTGRILEVRSQAKDHPVALAVPETEYLKCVIMAVN
ncbi:MAG: class I SAM-dependent rRNA methyltransferase [Deltaproteobacteria bacterium]|nr:class I SAM-dependent rRNA methyltransferase [Deltaproteobacteria bacterium]